METKDAGLTMRLPKDLKAFYQNMADELSTPMHKLSLGAVVRMTLEYAREKGVHIVKENMEYKVD